jgi:DNA-cytosine methyltransferase
MKVGSLFSGIGGIDLGFEREGFETRWFVENNEFCQKVLRKHWPSVPIYGDIRKINFRELEPVEIIIGGFPCQDISTAGHQKGIHAERSGLWSEYYRAICEIRPRIAVIENVPNLVNLGLDVVLTNLTEAGYNAEWFTLCASDFGALHKRERIFIVAYRGEVGCVELKSEIDAGESGKQAFSESFQSIIAYLDEIDREQIRGGKSYLKRCFVADNWKERIQRFREESLQGKQGFSWCKNVRRIEDLKGRTDIPEPLFRGSCDGVPCWAHRVAACGNAVVPQVAQFIARQIKERWINDQHV